MDKTFLLLGAVAAFLAVALGAFGAHGLRARLSPEMLAVFQTGVQYHMYHALALILVAAIMGRMSGWLIQTAGWCFVAGIVFFSGSLYLLAITGVTILGAITPIGGLLFLIGWACSPSRPSDSEPRFLRDMLRVFRAFVAGSEMIRITDTIVIEERELDERFVRASGPGGQNVNKVSTAVELRFDVGASSLPPESSSGSWCSPAAA